MAALKQKGRPKPDSQDETGMLSDALREERMRKALADLHTAMDGNQRGHMSRLDGVDRSDWPEPATL